MIRLYNCKIRNLNHELLSFNYWTWSWPNSRHCSKKKKTKRNSSVRPFFFFYHNVLTCIQAKELNTGHTFQSHLQNIWQKVMFGINSEETKLSLSRGEIQYRFTLVCDRCVYFVYFQAISVSSKHVEGCSTQSRHLTTPDEKALENLVGKRRKCRWPAFSHNVFCPMKTRNQY